MKLTNEERLRRAVAKAARASARAHNVAWKAHRAWRDAAEEARCLVAGRVSEDPSHAFKTIVDARHEKAQAVESEARWNDFHSGRLAKLMGAETPR